MSNDYKNLLTAALSEIRTLKEKLAKAETVAISSNSPIAVVGVACRFAKNNSSPEEFTSFLKNGGDAVGPLPEGRWADDWVYDADRSTIGSLYTTDGSYLDEVWSFDNEYFDISAREASFIDPQLRHLLELSVSALEESDELHRCQYSKTGLFMTAGEVNYAERTLLSADRDRKNGAAKLGVNRSLGIGRIAHCLKLEGPAILVDSTCSSSLLAIHLACQSLTTKETDLALAGGFNLMLSANDTIGFCGLQALSPDGRCRTFDSAANGYGRGEGGGVVVLKRLEDALKDGNPIHGLIRGSAANNDGESNGLTAPNGRSQEKVILQAMRAASVRPEQVRNIEAHGTGTPLGDPIELNALSRAYRPDALKHVPLIVGSVKSNLGHLEEAAGMASLIKVLMSYREQKIFRSLHCDQPTSHFRWESNALQVADGTQKLGTDDYTGISGFGMSGTNVHLIVSGFEKQQQAPTLKPSQYPVVAFSAHSPAALKQRIEHAHHCWSQNSPDDWKSTTSILNYRRVAHAYRAAFVAEEASALLPSMKRYIESETSPVVSATNPKTAFLFSGQGATYPGMAKSLYESEAVFRDTLNALETSFFDAVGIQPTELMWGNEQDKLGLTQYQQPALVLYQYALAQVLLYQGVTPSIVLGHSLGEFVAAVIANIMDIEQAIELAATRGRLVSQTAPGKMLLVWSPKQTIVQLGLPETLSIAIENSPSVVVVSGPAEAVDTYAQNLQENGIRTRFMNATHAFHTTLLETVATPWKQALSHSVFRPAEIPVISNLTGKVIDAHMSTPDYWYQQLVGPVRFGDCIATLIEQDIDVAIDFGPRAQLPSLGKTQDSSIHWLAIDEKTSASAMARLWCRLFESGHSVPAGAGAVARGNVRVPAYQFVGNNFCLSTVPVNNDVEKSSEWIFDRSINTHQAPEQKVDIGINSARYPHMSDHRILGDEVTAAACYLSILIAFLKRERAVIELRDVAFKQAYRSTGESFRFRISITRHDDQSHLVLSGKTGAEQWEELVTCSYCETDDALQAKLPQTKDPSFDGSFYQNLETLGYELGVAYRWLQESDGQMILQRPDSETYWHGKDWHPGLIDSGFHALVRNEVMSDNTVRLFLPFFIESIRVNTAADNSIQHSLRYTSSFTKGGLSGDLEIFGNDELCFQLTGMKMLSVDPTSFRSSLTLYKPYWKEANPLNEVNSKDTWVAIGADEISRSSANSLGLPYLDLVTQNFSNSQSSSEVTDLASFLESRSIDRLVLLVPPFAENWGQNALRLCQWLTTFLLTLSSESNTQQSLVVFSCDEKLKAIDPVQSAAFSFLATASKELGSPTIGRLVTTQISQETQTLIRSLPTNGDYQFNGTRFEQRHFLPTQVARVSSALDYEAVLVIGANGALGFEVAKTLLDSGCQRLLLHSRNGLDTGKLGELKERAYTSEIEQIVGDLTSANVFLAQQELLCKTPISAVIYCAGSVADAMLANLTDEDFRQVFDAKVTGVIAAHDFLEHADQRNARFVVFSSLSSLIGNAGQANYAAANGFVDALMAYRNAQGLHGLSINWGPWQGGMVTKAQLDSWQAVGLKPIQLEEGTQLCLSLLRTEHPQLAIADIDEAQFTGSALDNPWHSLFGDSPTPSSTSQIPSLKPLESIATAQDSSKALHVYLYELVNPYLDSITSDHHDDSLVNLGLNSIMVLEVRQKIQSELSVDVPVHELFQLSLNGLHAFLADRLINEADSTEEIVIVQNSNSPNWNGGPKVLLEL